MPRPRLHDPDAVLDVVEALVARSGPGAVSIRAVSAEMGMSNGALYHTFTSRSGLMAQAWLRAGQRFLAVQAALVDRALSSSGPAEAVVAAADAPVAFAEQSPAAAALLWSVRREDILAGNPPNDAATALRNLDRLLVGLMVRLAVAMWDRRDAAAVDVITACIVDLPTALVLQRDRVRAPTSRAHLHAAVRAVLAVGPPPDHRQEG
ncbi:MAG: TetR/AcrR family transcriptional regulator [Actinomycetota bacterium]